MFISSIHRGLDGLGSPAAGNGREGLHGQAGGGRVHPLHISPRAMVRHPNGLDMHAGRLLDWAELALQASPTHDNGLS